MKKGGGEGGPSAILPYPHCIFKNMQSEDVFVQNSDLATLGRRTGAIETLVGQLREAAEATNLPQDEGKGNDFIQSLMSIQFIAQKTVEWFSFYFFQSNPSIKFIQPIHLADPPVLQDNRKGETTSQTANKQIDCMLSPFSDPSCSCTFVLHQHLWFRGRNFCPKQITVSIKFPATMLSYLSLKLGDHPFIHISTCHRTDASKFCILNTFKTKRRRTIWNQSICFIIALGTWALNIFDSQS